MDTSPRSPSFTFQMSYLGRQSDYPNINNYKTLPKSSLPGVDIDSPAAARCFTVLYKSPSPLPILGGAPNYDSGDSADVSRSRPGRVALSHSIKVG